MVMMMQGETNTHPLLCSSSNSNSSGGGLGAISWATLGSKSQSLLRSLWVNLLLSFSTLWHWLQHFSKTGAVMMKYSGVNSEPLELSDHEDVALDKFKVDSQADDSCSGYCSGSGSSLPGSPIPKSCLKDQLLSSDEHDEHEEERDEVVEGQETLPLRRDSDTSDSSVDNVDISPETVSRIVAQVESMFSDDHLAKDGFLLKHVRRRSDGFVSLKLVAGLRKVKQISREFPVVLNALKVSEKMEVNAEGTKIRRKEPLTSTLKSMPIKQAKKDKNNKADKETEKENQQVGAASHDDSESGNGNHALGDEQQIARKRRPKGDRFNQNQLQFDRGSNHHMKRSSIASCTDETPLRRRGGSLPIPSSVLQHRGSTPNYMYTLVSPPSGSATFARPKSNSYSEGSEHSNGGMSSWLQRRKASAVSTRLSSGDISLNGVIRQPRGPDGTKGFHPGYRTIIMEEKYILS